MLKSRKITYLMILTLLITTIGPSMTLADSVAEIKNKEAEVKEAGKSINEEIDAVVATINNKYQELAKLDAKITESQTEVNETEEEIAIIQASIEKRTEVVGDRMKDVQVRGVGNSSLEALLDAESFSDFLNRAYAVTVIQNAEQTKITSLYEDKTKLSALEVKLLETQTSLEEQQKTAQAEKIVLDADVASLKVKLADNASALEVLTSERISKENTIREAALAAQAAKKASDEAALKNTQKQDESPTPQPNQPGNSTTGSTNNSNSSNNNQGGGEPSVPVPPTTPVVPPVAPPATSGIRGQATAYIATGNNTATGTVPTTGRTIAVDRNLIPLGSAVQIDVPSAPQYSGVYIAEDTGGAVNGYIIDIFVGSLTEAKNFGRREIFITVL